LESSLLGIKIIAPNPDLKGKSFERFMQLVLDKLGYGNFKVRVHTTGMELDIEARDKEYGQPILCECKAHEQEIDTGELLKFFGKLCHQRSNNKSLKGKFFSISGFSGTALKNYEELNNEDKEIFSIYGNNEILELLRTNRIVASNEEINTKIMANISGGYVPGKRYFVFFDSELYLVQLINIAGKPRSYIILSSSCEMVDSSIRQKISSLDPLIASLEEFDLEILDKVAINLLDLKKKTPEAISIETGEKLEDIKISLEELKLQGIVSESNNDSLYSITSNIESLKALAMRLTVDEQKKYKFMSSTYLESLINDEFVKHVVERFRLVLDDQYKRNLITICKVFPSALCLVLFRQTLDFENNYRFIEESKLGSSLKEKWHQSTAMSLMNEALAKAYQDLNISPGRYLDNRGIRGFTTGNILRIASDSGLILDLEYRESSYLAIASGRIEPGQPVAGGVDTIYKIGLTLMDLRQYHDAVTYFDKVLDMTNEIKYLSAAWNNKGLCFLRSNNHVEAIPCFRKVLSYDSKHPEATHNLEVCYVALHGLLEEMRHKVETIRTVLDNK
jgi:tetratricopeptide (TPR) repeat protein